MTQEARSREFYLREWRIHRGLSQAELARRMGTTSSRISQVEGGSERYNETFLRLAAQELECTPAQLLAGPPSQMSEAADILYKLTPERREDAVRILRALADTGSQDAYGYKADAAPNRSAKKRKK